MSVTFPLGFRASGVASGIKESGALDLAVVASETARLYSAAGTFTKNLAAAAPVLLSKLHLESTAGYVSAILLSSGNANAATGKKGDADALSSASTLAGFLGAKPTEVLVASTGLIGIPLPIQRLIGGIPNVVESLGSDQENGLIAAKALMTTDTFPKVATFEIRGVRFGGIAKGAAMISPNMATMLAVVTTDSIASPETLSTVLGKAVDESFNRITIDGCTSTNDSVFVMASGKSGIELSVDELQLGITMICKDLAGQIVFDAEGATKVIFVDVTGAKNEADALRVARKIAESSLVKCSFFGKDPYWGRVLSEVGSSGVDLDISKVSIAYGDEVVYQNLEELAFDKGYVENVMQDHEIHLVVDLGAGTSDATIITADLTPAYIAENMRTS